MDRSLDEIISERPQRGGGRRSDRRAPPPRGPRRDEGPRDGVRKNRRDDRADVDGDWVHDRYDEDRSGQRRGGYEDDYEYDRRAPARRAPDDDTGKIRVDNLHYELTEDDISELFNRIGPVLSARLLYDRSDRSQGTAFVTYEDPRDARVAVREFDGANANGQPIRLTQLHGNSRRGGAEGGSLFDRIEKPSRSMFERIDSSDDVGAPRRRGGGGRRDDRSFSPRKGLRADDAGDRYARDSRSPLPGRRAPRERGGRRPGVRREENARGGGRGGKKGEGRPGARPKKTAEELDAEMEDYFGGGGGGNGAEHNESAQQQQSNGGGAAAPAAAAPAAVGDDDIDMIE